MTENRTEDNGLDGPLTTAERKALTAYLIETIGGWEGETPFQRAPDRDGGELKYPPDLKANRLFPHIGYREASRIGKHFEGAYAVKTRTYGRQRGPKLHLVTLRLNAPPSPDALDEHLSRLSKVVSQVFDDIQHSTSVPAGTVPLLTALHIRMSDVEPGRFDPHAHAIFEIPGDTVSSVRDYLAGASTREGDPYFGAVWVDEEPVKTLRNAAFYVAAGVVDYRRLREWPEAALMAVWNLSRRKMLRRAGWFGASPVENGVETNKDALGSPSPAFGQSHTTTSYQGPPGAAIMDDDADRAASDWRASLFHMLSPYRPAEYARLTKSTVRRVSAGNRNLLAYPTIGEILACAIFVIEAEQRDYGRKYTEVLDAYRFEQKQFEESQRRVESFFHIRLFHPGIGYMPTAEGVTWAKTVMLAFEPILKLAEEGRRRLIDSYGDNDRLGQDLIRGR